MSARHPSIRRIVRWLAWSGAWAVLTGAGTALHWGAWIAPTMDPPVPTFLGQGIFRHLANLMTIPATPGWLSGHFLMDKLPAHSIWGTLVANGIGWLVCLLGCWMALQVRGAMVAQWAEPQAAPQERGGAAEPHESRGESGPDLARRRFMIDSAFAGAAMGGSGALVHSTTMAPWNLELVRYRVPIRDLPASLEGMRLAVIADTHLGPRVPESHVIRAVGMALDLKPDLFVLNGDYVHNGIYQIAPAAQLFAEHLIKPAGKTPVVGVLGNHDWYASGRVSRAELSRVGVRMLDNTRTYFDGESRGLRPEPTSECLCVAGLGECNEDVTDVLGALGGVPETMPRLVVAHNPDSAEHPALLRAGATGRRPRVDLMTCGHTHGGQVRLPLIGTPVVPSKYGQRYAHGLIQGPAFPVIVSAGVGLSIVPIRFNVPPEVVEITLVRA